MAGSPLQIFILNQDKKYLHEDEEYYYIQAMNSTQDKINQFTELFKREVEYRAEHIQNFVMSISGDQGSGKSLAGYRLTEFLSHAFGVKFDLNVSLAMTQDDALNKVRVAKKKNTIWLDEQRKAEYGVMGNLIGDQLADFEDQLRKEQINFIYCSPELRKHSHFFVFETLPEPIGLVRGKDGYPLYVRLMLKTKRHFDKEFMTRGIIELKTPSMNDFNVYNKIKQDYLTHLKEGTGGLTNSTLKEDAEMIYNKIGHELIKKTKKGDWIIVSDMTMERKIYALINERKYTTHGHKMLRDFLRERIAQGLQDLVLKLNDSCDVELPKLCVNNKCLSANVVRNFEFGEFIGFQCENCGKEFKEEETEKGEKE